MLSPILLLTVISVMALTVTLTIAVWRTLARPTGIQDFDSVIATVTGGEVSPESTALLKTSKNSNSWSWNKWWLDAALKAGRVVKDPGSPGRVMLGFLILSMIFGFLVYPGGIIGLYLGFLSIGVGRLWLSFEVSKRRMALERQMPLLLSGLRTQMAAGDSLQKAMMGIADNLPNPIGIEMKRVRDDVNVSIPLTKALENLAQRVDSRLMVFFVSSLGVGIKSGSDLIPQLITLEGIIRMRARIEGKIRSAVALAKPTAYLAMAAPPLMFVYSAFTQPTYLSYFFGKGFLMFIASIVMYVLGIGLIQIMIKNVEKV